MLVIDLLAKVIPDVQLTSAGPVGTVPRLRHIGGEEWGGNSPALDADSVATVVAFEAAGARYLVVELTLGHSDDRNEVTDLLAVFDADLSLIDAADIGFDQRSSLVDPVTLSVGPGDDVLVARGAHHNSSQSDERPL